MKWLFPTIAGGLVLALGLTFTRAVLVSKAADTAAQRSKNYAQLAPVTKRAAEVVTLDASRDAKPSEDDAAKTETSADAAPASVENNDTPRPSAGDASKPGSPDNPELAEPGSPLTKSASRIEEQRKMRIFEAQHHDAASLAKVLQRLWPKLASGGVVADSTTNSLIFRDGIEPDAQTLLQHLDRPTPAIPPGRAGSEMEPDGSMRKVWGKMFGKRRDPAVSDPASEQAAQEYRQHEAQALVLASAYRQQQATSPGDSQKLEQLKGELQGAVHAAFHARQTWQRSQAAQLRNRLKQIERRISERGQVSSEIIDRRVDELLHPEKQWESNDDGGNGESAVDNSADRAAVESRPAQRARTYAPSQEKLDGDDSISASSATEGRPASPSESARRFAGGSLPESAGDVRKDLLNAEAAVASAQAVIAETKAAYERSESSLKYGEELLRKGATTEKHFGDTATEFERNKAALSRAESELGIKERLLEAARDMLAVEIKFREADLADAKLRMDHAAAELSRFAVLFEQKAISQDVYESKKLPPQLAATQYERAKMLLDLYRKALPDQTSFVDKTRVEPKLTLKSVWMTDFAAAEAAARKLHRPLIVFFQASWSAPDRRMEKEVLAVPEVLRIVSERFVAVHVDVDANKEKVQQYGISRIPSVLVLGEEGRIIRLPGGLTAKQFLDTLEKIGPDGRHDDVSIGSTAIEPPQRAPLGVTPDALGDPRKRILDAAHAVTSTRAAITEAKVLLAISEQHLKALESVAPGAVPQKTILDARNEIVRNRAALERMVVDLDIKESQLEDARDMLATQIKLLEIDLADAKLRLEHASDESLRATQLLKTAAISKEEYETKALAERLAASQQERAQTLLELYRKALPAQKASDDKDREEEKMKSNKTSAVRPHEGGTSNGATDGEFAEVPLGDFSFSNGTAAPGMTIHVDFKLSAVATSKQAQSLESQLKLHQGQVREAVNKIVRMSSLEELNDPNLATIKRLIRDDINRVLRKSYVVEVVITDVRTMEQ